MHIFEFPLFGIQIAPTWYGLMYALGFMICYLFIKKFFNFREKEHVDTLLICVFLGVVLGGRLGYVLFYNPLFFIAHPMEVLKIWTGGMSFHGGLLGVILAVYLFARRYGYNFWKLIDTLAVVVPIALGLWRIGNWINGELYGYWPYTWPIPMVIDGVPHFPSPILEMFLEGILLFLILFILFIKRWFQVRPGIYSWVFLIGYALSRLIAECFRLPDAHIGYLFGTHWVTLGILYTIPMLIFWVWLITKSVRK
jgi:phosphatidylglycerol:prolipoprotein diacylglycerol transferase